MFEKMSGRVMPFAAGAVLGVGGVAMTGCGESVEGRSIDCFANPGQYVEVSLDLSNVGDRAILRATGFAEHEIEVFRGNPNVVYMGAEGTPLGEGGNKEEIDSYGPAGKPLFGNVPGDGAQPPYYTSAAIGRRDSSIVIMRLTCDPDQSPR